MKETNKDHTRKAQRRVVTLSRKLSEAYELHEQERVRGQQKIDQARLGAEKRLAKIAHRVDLLIVKLEQARSDAASAARKEKTARSKKGRKSRADVPRRDREVASPSAAADVIEDVARDHQIESNNGTPLIVSESVERESPITEQGKSRTRT